MKPSRSRISLPLKAIPILIITGAILLVTAAGVAGAASNSQPGDLLYGVRRPALMLQMAVTTNPIRYSELQSKLNDSAAQVEDSPEIEVEAEPTDDSPDLTLAPAVDEVEFSGTITEIGGGFIVVAGETVSTLNTEVKGALALGAIVRIQATRAADGTLMAREVSVTTDPSGDANTNLNANEDLFDDNNANIDNANDDDLLDGNNTNLDNANSDDQFDDSITNLDNANDDQFDDRSANLNNNSGDDLFDDNNANANINVNQNANLSQGGDDQQRDANVNSNTGSDDGGNSGSGGEDRQSVDDGSRSGSSDNSGDGNSGGERSGGDNQDNSGSDSGGRNGGDNGGDD